LDEKMSGEQLKDGNVELIHKLHGMSPSDDFITYNHMFCELKREGLGNKVEMNTKMVIIDSLYNSEIDPKDVNGLNLEFQFRVLDMYDSIPGSEQVIAETIERIKSFYNLKESTWQNSLKLAQIFMAHNDLKFATELLEPFIETENVDSELLFTFISVSAGVPEKQVSKLFPIALRKAKELDKKRYCSLFGAPKLSFQVLDNPEVKKDYCDTCY